MMKTIITFTLFLTCLCFSVAQFDPDNPCDRNCVPGRDPMTCEFDFVVELTTTLSKACYDCPSVLEDCDRPDCNPGDGIERGIVTINRYS